MTARTLRMHAALENSCSMNENEKKETIKNAAKGMNVHILPKGAVASSINSLTSDGRRSISYSLYERDSVKKSVRFSDDLISHVWERPRTLPEDRNNLFYTGSEITNFRREYRSLIRERLKQRKSALDAHQGTTLAPKSTLSFMLGFMQRATQLTTGSFSISPSSQNPVEIAVLVDTMYLF